MKHIVEMNKLFLVAAALLMALSSCQSTKVKISGRFVGSEADMVYLEQASTLNQTIIDSVKLSEDGNFMLKLDKVSTSPSLYHIVYEGNRIPLLLQGGDHITVNSAGNALRNYTVAGSEESELLHEFNHNYVEGMITLNELMSRLTADDLSDAERQKLAMVCLALVGCRTQQLSPLPIADVPSPDTTALPTFPAEALYVIGAQWEADSLLQQELSIADYIELELMRLYPERAYKGYINKLCSTADRLLVSSPQHPTLFAPKQQEIRFA